MIGNPIVIKPQPGPQAAFLSSPADIVIYGGAAGGGKTYGLLLEPLRHIHNPRFGAVVLRRTRPEITKTGGMWDEARNIYPLLGGVPNETELSYRFSSGAKIAFTHIQYDKDLADWRGAQVPLFLWDQLETFTKKQFFYMLSRNRSTSGIRPYQRATCNPEPGWLAEFIAWWIAEDGYADLSRAGVLRWFVRVDEQVVWADSPGELLERYPGIPPKSCTFIPSTIYDNKFLLEKDPGYLANLMAMSLVDRERLLGDPKRGGNWKIVPTAGNLFNRAWVNIVPAAPAGGVIVLFWDFAATEKKFEKDDPDYTAAVAQQQAQNRRYYIHDAVAVRAGPADVEKIFVNISRQWASRARSLGCAFRVRWEVEPGSAGKREAQRLVSLLAGLDAKGIPSVGDKIERGKPFVAQAEAGNVDLVEGGWNEEWLAHMHNQPDLPHDDIWDATTGGFNDLAGNNGWADYARRQMERKEG